MTTGKTTSTKKTDALLDLDYRPRMPRRRGAPIGCIGAGFIMADCHLPAYLSAGFHPVAIASRTPDRARQVAERHGLRACESIDELLADREIEILDVAVPPQALLDVIRRAVRHKDHLRGILAQKPLGVDYADAKEIVRLCRRAKITLAVNQNMRYDQSIRACKQLLDRGALGEPVFASIDMRAIPHWMPWQKELGWVTLRIMSIHHLDAFRFLFGDPQRVFASVRPDPRTSRQFKHEDGICLYILEYKSGLRASSWDDVYAGPDEAEKDVSIRWRVEGTEGVARGTIGWPDYPHPTPSTLDFTTAQRPGYWFQPRWKEVWFPDAFAGTMAQLLCAVEDDAEPEIGGRDNLRTMALVEACYLSAAEHRAVAIREITGGR